MQAQHKRLMKIFQVLLLALLIFPITQAKAMSGQEVLQMIQTGAKKKDFSQEFTQIVKAPASVESTLINVLQGSSNRWEERWFCAITLGKRKSENAKKALLVSAKDPLFI